MQIAPATLLPNTRKTSPAATSVTARTIANAWPRFAVVIPASTIWSNRSSLP